MRQLVNLAAILLGIALIVWAVLAASGVDVTWLASKYSLAGRERSEVLLAGALGLALVGYAGFNLLLAAKPQQNGRPASRTSSPEA